MVDDFDDDDDDDDFDDDEEIAEIDEVKGDEVDRFGEFVLLFLFFCRGSASFTSDVPPLMKQRSTV